jgi:3'(2'), 5'-bisphosphate nucleotidase
MIRKFLVETLVVFLLALAAAGTCWAIKGGPEREAGCDPAKLEPGYICFSEALELEGIVWVDARERKLWERNGREGSVLLTDHPSEDWDALMAEVFGSLASAQAVVVYCATEGCGSSEPVALGSSLKFCRLAEGGMDVYPRFGPTSEWDTAAGQDILEGAGGAVLDSSGRAFRYNQRDTLLNGDFVAFGDVALRDALPG